MKTGATRTVSFVALLIALVIPNRPATALSTLTATLGEHVIAGPGIEHRLTLVLRYFPGDGEAVIRCEVTVPSSLLLKGAGSRGGMATIEGNTAIVEYAASPRAGRESADTLEVVVVARVEEADVHLEGAIYSSLDAEGEPAHVVWIPVSVRPPVALEVEWSPREAFPGQSVDIALTIRNLDERGRSITGFDWDLPEGVERADGHTDTTWDSPLAAGHEVTSVLHVRVDPGQSADFLTLGGVGKSEDLIGSPLPPVSIALAVAPSATIEPAGQIPLVVGETTELTFIWVNTGTAMLEVDGLEVLVPRELGARPVKSDVTEEPSQDGARFKVKTDGLSPGAAVRLALSVTPSRPGPFRMSGFFRPTGQAEFVPMATGPSIAVAAQRSGEGRSPGAEELTDLEAVSLALREELEQQLESLQLKSGTRLYLKSSEDQKSWIVDDILSRALRKDGYRIVLEEGTGVATKVSTLHYRLVDARVIYSSEGGSWNPFSATHKREAYGDLFLHLEDPSGDLVWARRVQAYRTDSVPSRGPEWSGGAAAVERTVIPSSHRVVEIGLSGVIAGGLVLVFFAP